MPRCKNETRKILKSPKVDIQLATIWNLQALKILWIDFIYAIQIEFFSLSDIPPSSLHIV